MPQLLRDRYVDPATGDYVIEAGQPATTVSALPSVYRAITTRRGSFVPDPELGSGLGERDLKVATEANMLLIKAVTTRSLDRLETAGLIEVTSVDAQLDGQSAALTIEIEERGQPATITTTI